MQGIPDPNQSHPIKTKDGEVWPHAVFLKAVIAHPNIEVGDYTYYNDFDLVDDYAKRIAPYLHPGCPEKLKIGKFVQIAHGTRFITSSANHQMDGVATYPFAIFGGYFANYQPNFPQKGDTVIGHDVWLGHDSVIMPGVSVGSGSIIATRAVVTKDVPPYCVVAGNPGKVIKSRFTDDEITRLLSIAWWDWPIEKITANIQRITNGDIAALEVLL